MLIWETDLEKIIALLESSGELKPHFQTVGEKFGKIYLIGIFIVSFLAFYITGDNEKAAEKIAKETGITEFHAGLFPEQKVAYIKSYIDAKKTVAMVGDGVNDAAAYNFLTDFFPLLNSLRSNKK